MSGGATYQLAYPITRKLRVAGGAETEEVVTEVNIRRLNGGDVRWIEKESGKVGTSLGLIARVTDLQPIVVDLIDAEDIAEIGKVIESFLPDSLKDGATSSGT